MALGFLRRRSLCAGPRPRGGETIPEDSKRSFLGPTQGLLPLLPLLLLLLLLTLVVVLKLLVLVSAMVCSQVMLVMMLMLMVLTRLTVLKGGGMRGEDLVE